MCREWTKVRREGYIRIHCVAPEPVAVGGCINGVPYIGMHKSPVPMPHHFCVEANHARQETDPSIIIFAESSVWERTQTMQKTKKNRDTYLGMFKLQMG
jgi:hypothetical protein